jgi:hypothetical protein
MRWEKFHRHHASKISRITEAGFKATYFVRGMEWNGREMNKIFIFICLSRNGTKYRVDVVKSMVFSLCHKSLIL